MPTESDVMHAHQYYSVSEEQDMEEGDGLATVRVVWGTRHPFAVPAHEMTLKSMQHLAAQLVCAVASRSLNLTSEQEDYYASNLTEHSRSDIQDEIEEFVSFQQPAFAGFDWTPVWESFCPGVRYFSTQSGGMRGSVLGDVDIVVVGTHRVLLISLCEEC